MPRAFSSGALSIWSYAMNVPPCFAAITFVNAAVNVVLPWSTCPIVPTFTCGLVRANFSLDTAVTSSYLLGPIAPDIRRSGGAIFDDMLADVRRRVGVLREFHRVRGAALAQRAQRRRITEHLRERDARAHDLRRRRVLDRLQHSAPTAQVAADVAHVGLGRHDLDVHDRLEQRRPCLAHAFLETRSAGQLERGRARFEAAVRAAEQRDFDVRDGIARDDAGGHLPAHAFVYGRDGLGGKCAARDRVDELVAVALRQWLEPQRNLCILVAAADLPNELTVLLDGLGDRLAIRDLGPADVRGDTELAQHAVDDDLEVQLAHAAQYRLAGLRIDMHAQRGVLANELRERLAQARVIRFGARLDSGRDDGLRKIHHLERDGALGIREAVPRRDVLEVDGGRDIAGAHLIDLRALVRVHLHETADGLRLVAPRHVDSVARAQHARVNAKERQAADGVARDLERERCERRLVAGATRALVAAAQHALDCGAIGRRRQIEHDGIQHGLHATVPKRRSAERGHDFAGQASCAQPFADLLHAQGPGFDELLGEALVGFGSRSYELRAIFRRLRRERGRDLALDDA